MSLSARNSGMAQMRKLYELRERRAIDAIAAQRKEVERFLGLMNEQRTLVMYLQKELDLLHEIRNASSNDELSPDSLKMESDRRHWLSYDLDQEIFYLPGFVQDVRKARRELALRQSEWARLRDRIAGLDRLAVENRSGAKRIEARQDDALQDDRRKKEVLLHG
jgi:hypothetical protein